MKRQLSIPLFFPEKRNENVQLAPRPAKKLPVRLWALGERRKMKNAKKALSEVELQREYPLADLAEGSFFRCEETSVGCYQVEGMDLWGRIVSVTGVDPEALLLRCVAEAKAINPDTQVTD